MQFIRNYKKILLTAAIILSIVLVLSNSAFAQRVLFPAGLFDKIRTFIFGDNAIHASDYKDGTILLIKPIATGVGEGRYEAGDIVSILDGEEMHKRFGDTDFLGYEEKSKLIPLYLKQKLTEEQRQELLASEYEQSNKEQETITKQDTNPPSATLGAGKSQNYNSKVKSDDSSTVILNEAQRSEESLDKTDSVNNPIPSSEILRSLPVRQAGAQDDKGRGVPGDDKSTTSSPLYERGDRGGLKKRRIYGVDYTLVLSDKDILTIRQEKSLNKIPEVKFEEIINKNTKLSYAVPATHPVFGSANATPNPPLFLEGIYAGGATDEKIPSNKRGAPSRVEGRGVYCESSASVVCLPKHLAIMENAIKTTKRIAAIIVPNVRAATESVKTVDTGGYADYTSLSAWEAAQQANLTSSDQIAIAKCRKATATSTADTTRVDVDGWTTDATRYIKIWTDPTESYRHNGVWDSAKYNLSVANSAALWIYEDYVRLDGLQIAVPSGNASGQTPVTYQGTTDTNDIQISNCIIKGHGNASYSQSGFWAGTSNHVALKMWNTIIYNILPASGNTGIYAYGSNSTASHVYNVTISGGQYGIHWVSGTAYIKNVIAFNTSSYDFNTVTYQINCASEDATADDCDGDGISSNNRINQNFKFADKANNDLRLYATDNTAQDYGTSSVSDIGFTTDINGQTRTGTWDIGADEMIARPVYRSVGPSKTDALAVGTNNPMTIQGYTATFASSVPDNIGVGDVIQYDRDNNSTIDSVAFISGRNSATSFSVQSADGWMASSTLAGGTISSDTDWSIFRAYTSIEYAERGYDENSGIDSAVQNFDTWSEEHNISSSSEMWNFAAYADGADNSCAIFGAGWQTSTTTYIRYYTPYLPSEVGASQRHSGKWTDDAYQLVCPDIAVEFYQEDAWVDGLQIKVDLADNSYRFGIGAPYGSKTGHIRVSNNIIWGALSGNSDYDYGILLNSEYIKYASVWNNIIYGFINGSSYTNNAGMAVKDGFYNAYVYNNTVYGNQAGIYVDSAGMLAKNNISYNNSDNYYGTFTAGSTNNLSGPGTDAQIPSTNAKNGYKVSFVSETGRDFHLLHTDQWAMNKGADLSADTYLPFNTDIDGDTRPIGGTWDIGADENAGSATVVGTNPYAKFDDANLIGYWSFDGATMGTTSVQDLSGNGNTGWFWYNPQKVSGIVGQALKFKHTDGIFTNTAVDIGDMSATEGVSNLSWSLWAKSDNYRVSDAGCYVAKADPNDGTGDTWMICQEDSSGDGNPADIWVTISRNVSDNYNFCYTESNILADKNGQWFHLAVTYDGTQTGNANRLKIYVDGQNQYINPECYYGEGSIPASTLSTNIDAFIGNVETNHEYGYNGLIDEVRIYNKTLTQAEIADLYRAGTAKLKTNDSYKGNDSGLVGWWTFDGADINWKTNTILDMSVPQGATDSFPENAVLDDFNRATEGPPPSSSWNSSPVNGVYVYDGVDIAAGETAATYNAGIWNATVANNQEAYTRTYAINEAIGVFLRADNSASNGYLVAWFPTLSNEVRVYTYVSGAPDTQIGSGIVQSFSAGDWLGARIIGNTINIFYKPSGGSWSQLGGNFTDAGSTYSSGKIGLMIYGDSTGIDDFGGGDSTATISATPNNGTAYNMSTTTSGVSGQIGQALKFDGTGSYINAGSNEALDNLGPMTIAAWIKPRPVCDGCYYTIAGKDAYVTSGNWWFYIYSYANSLVFSKEYGGDPMWIRATNAVDINKWNFVTMTWDGSAASHNVHIYNNGVENANYDVFSDGTGDDLSDADLDLYIGGNPYGTGYVFDGLIDDLRIYNRILSDSEISDLYKQGGRRMKVAPN